MNMNFTMDKQIEKLLSDAPQILKSAHRSFGNAHRTATNLVRTGASQSSTARSNFKELFRRYGLKRVYARDTVTHFPETREWTGDPSGITKREKTPLTSEIAVIGRSQREEASGPGVSAGQDCSDGAGLHR